MVRFMKMVTIVYILLWRAYGCKGKEQTKIKILTTCIGQNSDYIDSYVKGGKNCSYVVP